MPDQIDYEMLAEAELAKASDSDIPAVQRAHLDQASVFATLAERRTEPASSRVQHGTTTSARPDRRTTRLGGVRRVIDARH